MLWYLKQSSLRWLVLLGQNFQISIFDCYSVVLEQCHLASRWCLHLYHRNQWKLNTLSDLSKRKISHQKLPPKAWLRKFIQKSCSVGTALLLVILDQLVEAQQDAQPATTVIRLQVKADLVHNSCPSNRVVMLDHVVNTSCELHSIKVRRKDYKWKWSFIPPTMCTCTAVLPEAFWGLDDGLHYVVSNELPVLFWDVTGRPFSACIISFTPVLCHHVLQVDHTWTTTTRGQR